MTLFDLHRLTDGMRSRIACLFNRGTVERVNDSGPLQKIQISILTGEVPDDYEFVGHFGFASNPPAGSEAILASVNGSRDNGVVIGTEHPGSRAKDLASGDSAVYNHSGVRIALIGTTIVISGAATVTIEGDVHITGNLVVDGTINGAHEPD